MRILSSGSTGPTVQLLQLALGRAGYGPLETDGVFGPATKRAVTAFQVENMLSADGVAGPQTHRALMPWYTGFATYRAVRGDSLFSIARRYSSTTEAIELANPNLNGLEIGEAIVVPLPFNVVPTNIAWSAALLGYCVRGLAARYPFLKAGEMGKSVMGKPLWTLTLGKGGNRVLYNASHHANEWITTPLLLKFTEELCAAYASGGQIYSINASEILDYASIFLVPAVNPDGIDLVTGELSGGEYYNLARAIWLDYSYIPFPDGWKANIRGIDLNLQYPAGWEQAKANKYAAGITSPAPADFVGYSPLSAHESRAMYDYTLAVDPALTLAYHTQGQVIYWRYLDYEPPGSRDIAGTLSAVSGYAVEETPYASGFAGYKDWFIREYNRPGYTVEAGIGVNPLPITQFDTIYRQNLGILTLAALLT